MQPAEGTQWLVLRNLAHFGLLHLDGETNLERRKPLANTGLEVARAVGKEVVTLRVDGNQHR